MITPNKKKLSAPFCWGTKKWVVRNSDNCTGAKLSTLSQAEDYTLTGPWGWNTLTIEQIASEDWTDSLATQSLVPMVGDSAATVKYLRWGEILVFSFANKSAADAYDNYFILAKMNVAEQKLQGIMLGSHYGFVTGNFYGNGKIRLSILLKNQTPDYEWLFTLTDQDDKLSLNMKSIDRKTCSVKFDHDFTGGFSFQSATLQDKS